MKIKSAVMMAFIGLALSGCGDNSVDQAPPSNTPPLLLANTVVSEAGKPQRVSIRGYRSEYTIVIDGEQTVVTSKADASDVQKFTGVQVIEFVDKHTSLDIEGTPGRVFRLYQAAFNRKPDLAGLGFWIHVAENNSLTMESIAGQFLASPESIKLYGSNPTNPLLLTAAYNNVLHRAPEQDGFNWWLRVMNDGLPKEVMIYSFSESPENKTNLLPQVSGGIDYAPFVAALPDAPPVEKIIAAVQSSNIEFLTGFAGRPAGTWHWPNTSARRVMVYIPQPSNNVEQDYASKIATSIAQINTRMGGLLVLEGVDAVPATGNYIRVSYNTAYVPAGSTNYSSFCANVSTQPYSGNPISPSYDNGISSGTVYVNLGNGYCDVSQDIVTHEFGHALGLADHFNGFGANGTPPVSRLFWDVLATLYGNPRSTPSSDLVVKRAK